MENNENEQEVEQENEQEVEQAETIDYTSILSDIQTSLETIETNQTNTYSLLQDINTQQTQIYNGIHFISNFGLFVFVICLMILVAKYIKHLL